MESLESTRSCSDEIREIFCEKCERKTQPLTVIADEFCKNCVTFMCKKCRRDHDFFLKDHQFCDKNKLPKDLYNLTCRIHSKEMIKFYCAQDKQFICTICRDEYHLMCEYDVHSVPDLAELLSEDDEYKDFISDLNSVDEKVDMLRRKAESHLDDIDKYQDKAYVEISRVRDEIIMKVQELADALCNKVNVKAEIDKKIVKSVILEQASLQANIEELKADVERKQKKKESCLLFMAMKQKKLKIRMIDSNLRTLEDANEISRYTFEPSPELTLIQEKLRHMDAFGKLVSENRSSTPTRTRRLRDLFRK